MPLRTIANRPGVVYDASKIYRIFADDLQGLDARITTIEEEGAGTPVDFGTDAQIPFMNATGDNFIYSSAFTFNSTTSTLATTNINLLTNLTFTKNLDHIIKVADSTGVNANGGNLTLDTGNKTGSGELGRFIVLRGGNTIFFFTDSFSQIKTPSSNKISLTNSNNFRADLDIGALTTNRTITFADLAGTVALTSTVASLSLNNLSGVAINTSLVSDTDSTDDLGSTTIAWANVYADNIKSITGNALTLTPIAGQNLNVVLSTTGDFAVNTSQLYVDTSTALVGIGTATPLMKLDVAGSQRITATASSTITGTADPTASTTLVGTGTLFLSELIVGDYITINSETRQVTAIADNTHLTASTAFTDTASASITRISAGLMVKDSSGANLLNVSQDSSINIGKDITLTENKIFRYLSTGASNLTITNSIVNNGNVVGMFSAGFNFDGSKYTTNGRALNILAIVRNTSVDNIFRGGYFSMRTGNAGAANIITGFTGEALIGGTGDVNECIGAELRFTRTATGTTTNSYGIKIVDLDHSAGTMTNTYGIYVGDMTIGTQTNLAYNIYLSDATARNYIAGNVGLGQTAPSAYLHLKAGTATASTAPLKFATGTNNTTAEAGTFEYNNTPHFTNSDATRRNIVLSDGTYTAGVLVVGGKVKMRVGGTDYNVLVE